MSKKDFENMSQKKLKTILVLPGRRLRLLLLHGMPEALMACRWGR